MYVCMAVLLVHWLSWSWFFLSGYHVHFLRVRMRYSGCKLDVVTLFSCDAWCTSRVVL
jgi:hypothetical protein